MKTLLALFVFVSFMSLSFAQGEAPKVAVASMLRGDVDLLVLGKTIKLKKDDWVREGSVVKTADKSFVKLIFIDKSQMNIGPNSEMKIAKFSGNESGIIDLVKGKVRSQVTKDYLQMKDKDKSKLFIKTPNAVMGIRGTDFMISTNGKNTAAVLFEGSVVFAKHENMRENNGARLEDVVNQGVRMHPGEFSVVEPVRNQPTVPARLNIEQRETLEKSSDMGGDRNPSTAAAPKQDTNGVVPDGLSGAAVSNTSDSIKSEVAQVADVAVQAAPAAPSSSSPEGYVNGDVVKPANGSFVHLDSGTIIPPGPGSVLDANTNTYIPGSGQGTVSATGEYVPPKNIEITTDGKIMVAFKDQSGATVVKELEKPVPVANTTAGGTTLSAVPTLLNTTPTLASGTAPITNDILNPNFVPGGSVLSTLSNNQQNTSGNITPTEAATLNTKTRTIIIAE